MPLWRVIVCALGVFFSGYQLASPVRVLSRQIFSRSRWRFERQSCPWPWWRLPDSIGSEARSCRFWRPTIIKFSPSVVTYLAWVWPRWLYATAGWTPTRLVWNRALQVSAIGSPTSGEIPPPSPTGQHCRIRFTLTSDAFGNLKVVSSLWNGSPTSVGLAVGITLSTIDCPITIGGFDSFPQAPGFVRRSLIGGATWVITTGSLKASGVRLLS